MNAVAKKTETETETDEAGDGKTEYRVTSGKFSVGRGKEKEMKVVGDIVRLTPAQAKSFADIMKKTNPVAEKAAAAETKVSKE